MNACGPASAPCLAAALDAGRFLMEHPDLAVGFMGAVKSVVIVLMVLFLAALFRRHSAVARCWILRLAFPALLLAAFWQLGAGGLPVVFVRIEAPAEQRVAEAEKFDLQGMLREIDAGPHPRETFVKPSLMPDPQADIFMPYGEPKPQELPVVVDEPPAAAAAPPLPRYSYTPASVPVAVVPAVPFREIIIVALDRWLSSVWYGGTLLVAAWLSVRHFIGLLWLRSRGKPASDAITATGDALTDALGMRRAIYREVPGLASPLLTGWFRARLWLPEETSPLPETQIRSILHHELAHHRRKDLPWQQLASFACAIWWWNPLVWMLRRCLRHEAELAADEVVVSRDGGHATDYAEALVQVARGWTAGDTRILRRTGVPMMGNHSAIERRVRAILADHPLRGRMGWTAGVAVFLIAIMGMGVASLTAIAQPAEPAPVVEKAAPPPAIPSIPEQRRRDEVSGMEGVLKLHSLMEQRQNLTPDYLHPPAIPSPIGELADHLPLDRLERDELMLLLKMSEAGAIHSPLGVPGRPDRSEPDEARLRDFLTKINNLPREARFRFVNGRNGEPIPGLQFALSADGIGRMIVAADGEGRYRFAVPERGTESLLWRQAWRATDLVITASPAGFVPSEIHFMRGQWAEELTIRLEPATPISGRVVGEDGKPVEGAKVQAWMSQLMAGLDGSSSMTDADGRWSMDGLPEDLGNVRFLVSHPDYMTAGHRGSAGVEYLPLTGQPPSALRDGTALLVLKNGPRIHGKVVDPNGNPVAGARLTARRGNTEAFTLLDGTFTLKRLTGEYALVTIEAEGYAPSQEAMTIEPAVGHVFTLRPPAVFRGRVQREDGTPFAGAEVAVHQWRNAGALRFRTRTDDGGRFQWNSAPDEPFSLNIRDEEGSELLTGYPVAGPREEIVISVKPALRIQGTAADEATGEPVPVFKVTSGTTNSWRKTSSIGSMDGRVELEIQHFEKEGLRFLIEAEGYQPLTTETYPTKQQSVEQVWRLKRK